MFQTGREKRFASLTWQLSLSLFVLLLAAACPLPSGVLRAADRPPDFTRQIRPLLAERCLRCHGPDDQSREAGLRLDRRQGATAKLESGQRAIVPGKPAASQLLARIATDDEFTRMPPPSAGKPLTAAEQNLLKQWIAAGAPYERHWSFIPPRQPPLPENLSRPDWVRNPIDRFVLARLDREDLQPAPPADRVTIIRRLSLDLTGLPPTIEQVQRFVDDASPRAYENLVDRLLASSAYGERWARVWLDLARYADSAGYAQDPPRTIWQYRDWVIQAINSNMPFDRFTVEQLAGDMLPDPTEDQLLATAFHRNTMTNSEGGTDDEEFRNAAVVDRVDTTLQVWMGLTMRCARCHTHKYDPITQKEYFQVFAIFNNTADADRGDERPTLVTMTAEQQQRKAELQTKVARLERELKEQPRSKADPPERAAAQKQLDAAKNELANLKGVATPIMRELPAGKRRTTRIQIRGNFRVTGDVVAPGVLKAFHPLPEGAEANRLTLARWLVDEKNPLTARVTVNRYWEQLFGTGLVETSEDFGTQGELPSHPELLDHLALGLMAGGWDVKQLLRDIVTSATYRQSSRVTPELAQSDPYNRMLARGPRFRLAAEMIRDQSLAVSGLLSRKMYGPSVRPPRPKLGLRAAFGKSTDWTTSPGADRYRRGLYTSWRRTTPYPSMTTFDAPSREVCTIRRIRTNTPLQALVTLNDPAFVEAAQALARRMVSEGGGTARERAEFGFRLCLARPPTEAELEQLVELYEKSRANLSGDVAGATQLATDPLGPLPAGMDAAELAAWTVVGNVLMNLDEFLARP